MNIGYDIETCPVCKGTARHETERRRCDFCYGYGIIKVLPMPKITYYLRLIIIRIKNMLKKK